MKYNGEVPRGNFDDFHWAFITVFQILTIEDWFIVLYDAMRIDKTYCIYFIACLFIGNIVLLNLFIAVLLDSVTNY